MVSHLNYLDAGVALLMLELQSLCVCVCFSLFCMLKSLQSCQQWSSIPPKLSQLLMVRSSCLMTRMGSSAASHR